MTAGLIPAHAGKTVDVHVGAVAVEAHPRSRGENHFAHGVGFRSGGSSPLTRGKLVGEPLDEYPSGLIPAHAGKTLCQRRSRCPRWAHPRSRGENKPPGLSATLFMGSSPLTRGKLTYGAAAGNWVGLIPAHAGKTTDRSADRGGAGAHPRSRGENPLRVVRVNSELGSSPLTRGKQLNGDLSRVALGLIPAHAGKTWTLIYVPTRPGAHPRSRGENHGYRTN